MRKSNTKSVILGSLVMLSVPLTNAARAQEAPAQPAPSDKASDKPEAAPPKAGAKPAAEEKPAAPPGKAAPSTNQSTEGVAPTAAPEGPAPPGAEAPEATEAQPAEPAPGAEGVPTEPSSAEPSSAEPGAAGPAAPPTRGQSTGDLSIFPQPAEDARALQEQGGQRPGDAPEPAATSSSGIFAEDWWSHTRPIFEIHGNFRTRAELFHNFSLGRIDSPSATSWPRPLDNQYTTTTLATVGPALCTGDESGRTSSDDPGDGLFACGNKTQSGANLRFRLNPELHVSDNLRVISQIDLLDNVVFGSTPAGYRFAPSDGGNYEVQQRSGYYQYGFQEDTTRPPISGVNSLQDSISVKRAWAEYTTPLGELRFGRMPNHWGLGIVANAGDGYDDDYQSTIDRLMFSSGIKPLDLVIAGMWDFPNEGAVGTYGPPGSQPYDLAQLDDVDQWGLILMRRKSPELTKQVLSQGSLIFNAGTYITLRKQLLANDQSGDGSSVNAPGSDPDDLGNGFARRAATMWVPDLWMQLLYKQFRFEVEAAAVLGSVESLTTQPDNQGDFTSAQDPERKLRQYGIATELEQAFVEDRLHLNFNFGWASGDPDAFDPGQAGNLVPGPNARQVNDDTLSTFRFHPAYRVDMILHRYLLGRVQGTYYFNPDISYDFMREASGQRLGGSAGAVWSRASEFVQAPGHERDLGLELHAGLYFQSKDGALNDKPGQMGGFFSNLQYAVLFPFSGLGYQDVESRNLGNPGVSAAHLFRLYLGVTF